MHSCEASKRGCLTSRCAALDTDGGACLQSATRSSLESNAWLGRRTWQLTRPHTLRFCIAASLRATTSAAQLFLQNHAPHNITESVSSSTKHSVSMKICLNQTPVEATTSDGKEKANVTALGWLPKTVRTNKMDQRDGKSWCRPWPYQFSLARCHTSSCTSVVILRYNGTGKCETEANTMFAFQQPCCTTQQLMKNFSRLSAYICNMEVKFQQTSSHTIHTQGQS